MAENITVSRPYAKAIFHVASNNNLLDDWDKILSSLSEILSNESIKLFLLDKSIKQFDKSNLVIDLLKMLDVYKSSFSKEIDNFIKVLSLHGRLLYIKDIHFLYKSYMNDKLGRAEAIIMVAYPINNSQKDNIVKYLSKRFNKHILASFFVDDKLLGGFLAKVDDFVFDASVYGNLISLRTKIMT